jgi:hypothetical protein
VAGVALGAKENGDAQYHPSIALAAAGFCGDD